MRDPATDSNACKVFVCAMQAQNYNAGIPHKFRTYKVNPNQDENCTIWEALRATFAHPEFFDIIKIGPPGMQQTFVDGGFVCNNPMAQTLSEASDVLPGQDIACVVSIGTGTSKVIEFPSSGSLERILPLDTFKAVKAITTDCEQVAEEMSLRFRHIPNIYFWFSVNQGMQGVRLDEWEKTTEAVAHTRAYIGQVETNQRLDQAVDAIVGRKARIAAARIDGTIPDAPRVKQCPPPSPVFTGWDEPLEQLKKYFWNEQFQQYVFVLHGLGGAGKTQIAHKFVEIWQER